MLKNFWRWSSNRSFEVTKQREACPSNRAGKGRPHRQRRHRKLRVEGLEDRYYLSASAGGSWDSLAELAPATEVPLPVISQEQAVALAVNNLKATPEGFALQNSRHTATFTSEGLLVEPTGGGPQWYWQLSYVGTQFNPLADVQVGLVAPESNGAALVSYDRGGLVEQYVIKRDAIEQQFVIPQPLALGGGDLVVAGTIHSAGVFEATADGWQWSTEAGAVNLGDVTVLDATGSEIAASMQVTAGGTRIVVDADALQAAVYPLLIDPEVGTNDFRISDVGPDAEDFDGINSAVAYNNTNNEYLVVWQGNDAREGDFEIFSQRINAATGAEVGTNDFRISDMGPNGNANFDAIDPEVAYNSVDNEYLVVWRGDNAVDDDFEVFGQRINAATGAEVGANDFGISSMGPAFANANFDAFSPAVAYNSTNNEYLVVWEGDDNTAPLVDNEKEIFGQRLNGAFGQAVGANDFRISDMGPDGNDDFDANDPAVAYNSATNEYLVAWTGDDNTDEEDEIFAQRLNAVSGAEVGTNDFRISDLGPDGDANFQAFDVAVAFNSTNNEYLVVFGGDDNIAPLVDNEFEIFGQRLNASGGAVGANDFRISDLGPNGDVLFFAFDPSVAYNSATNQYLMTFNGNDNTAPLADTEFEIFGQRLDAAGAEVGANDFRISDMGPNGDPDFAGLDPSVSFNSTNNRFLVVWEGDDLTDDGDEIFGQRLDAAGAAVGANDFRLSDMGIEEFFAAFDPAVAYNSTDNEYLVVWVGDDATSNEREIFGQRINATNGSEVGTNDFKISDMGPDGNFAFSVSSPAVTYNSTNNEYLVVWSGEDNIAPLVVDEFEIFGQRLSATGTALGANDFRISDMGPDGNKSRGAFNPAAAYNSTNNEYVVVWNGEDTTINENEIFGQRLNAANGAAVGTNDFRISDMGPDGNDDFDAFNPAVAYDSTNNRILVVWEGDDNTAPLVDNESEIFGQLFNAANGAAVGPNDFRISDMGPNGNVAFDAFRPAVAYNFTNDEYLVVWEGDDNTAPLVDNEFEIFGQRLNKTGLQIGFNDFRLSDMGPNGNTSFGAFDPAVAYNSANNEYVVAWRGDDNTAPLVDEEFEIFGQQVSAAGAEVGANDFRLSDMGPNGNADFDAFTPDVAYNSTDNQYLMVWDGLDAGGTLGDAEREIFGQLFEVGDFGDAPDSYATRQAANGAWHRLGTPLFLGARVDSDADGLPTADATGDDATGSDDEDGVTIEPLTPGSQSTVRVVASAPGKLDAFFDFNGDGDFADQGEKIFNSVAVTAGPNNLSFAVPAGARPGNTFARFRLSSAGGLAFSGRAADGEVEDYTVSVEKVCFGTTGSDVLLLRPALNPPGAVRCNRVTSTGEVTLQTFAPAEPIVVMALAGADVVSVVSGVTRDVVIDGGDGNDQINGGPAADLLLGGEGNDWLVGGAGRDVLIGGTGEDVLLGSLLLGGFGGRGDENLLIGDRTIYDHHSQALRDILREWSSADSFDTRVMKLRDGTAGGPLNVSTVLDDHATDLLIGIAGRNWFWRHSRDLLVLFGSDDELN